MGQLMKHMKAMKAMRAMKGMKLTRQLAYTMARQARLTKPQLGVMAPQVPTGSPWGRTSQSSLNRNLSGVVHLVFCKLIAACKLKRKEQNDAYFVLILHYYAGILGQRSLGILYLGRVQLSLVKLLQLYPEPQTPAFFFC